MRTLRQLADSLDGAEPVAPPMAKPHRALGLASPGLLLDLHRSLEALARSVEMHEPVPPPPPELEPEPDFQPGFELAPEPAGIVEAAPAPAPPAAARELPAHPAARFEVLQPNCHPGLREGFRKLRNRIEEERRRVVAGGGSLTSVAVLSVRNSSGRSLTARNLAAVLASGAEARVLLVDADVTRPAVHHRFGVPQSPGLAESLADPGWLQHVWRVPGTTLHVLTAGQRDRESIDALPYSQVPAFLGRARAAFDWIILDAPSLESADAEILSRLTDGSVLVVRCEQTFFDETEAALRRVDRSRLLGAVLNFAP